MTNTPLQTARNAAAQGIKVFPFDPITKKPYKGFTNWQERATTDDAQIQQWWIMWPEAMIAAPTGKANGFFVVDVDVANNKQGLESLRALEAEYGELPTTAVVRTPSGGLHFYFAMPEHDEIKNSTSQLAEHIDIRGDGGCIIMAGSIRPNGVYEQIADWRDE